MKKLILILVLCTPIILFAQHLQLNDLFYLYEHSKSECDSYLISKNFNAEPIDNIKVSNGCFKNAWTYNDLNQPYEFIAKICNDGMKGNVRYITLSRKVHDDLLQQYKDHNFTFHHSFQEKDGKNVDLYQWFNCIGYFSEGESVLGHYYVIGLEHIRDKE